MFETTTPEQHAKKKEWAHLYLKYKKFISLFKWHQIIVIKIHLKSTQSNNGIGYSCLIIFDSTHLQYDGNGTTTILSWWSKQHLQQTPNKLFLNSDQTINMFEAFTCSLSDTRECFHVKISFSIISVPYYQQKPPKVSLESRPGRPLERLYIALWHYITDY